MTVAYWAEAVGLLLVDGKFERREVHQSLECSWWSGVSAVSGTYPGLLAPYPGFQISDLDAGSRIAYPHQPRSANPYILTQAA
jgi:hypothetical protein